MHKKPGMPALIPPLLLVLEPHCLKLGMGCVPLLMKLVKLLLVCSVMYAVICQAVLGTTGAASALRTLSWLHRHVHHNPQVVECVCYDGDQQVPA
jgi:hypothetical protein